MPLTNTIYPILIVQKSYVGVAKEREPANDNEIRIHVCVAKGQKHIMYAEWNIECFEIYRFIIIMNNNVRNLLYTSNMVLDACGMEKWGMEKETIFRNLFSVFA